MVVGQVVHICQMFLALENCRKDYKQGYRIVLISKICPYFEVLRLRKYHCPYF